MQFQLIMVLVIIALVVLYVYLKRTGHKEENLPAVSMSNPPVVSEDVNLPAKLEENTNSQTP